MGAGILMNLSGLALLLVLGAPQTPDALREAVAVYWDSLAKRDQATAMQFVVPESRNAFLQRRRAPFQEWRLKDIVDAGPGRRTVFVEVQKVALGSGFHDLTIAETWVLAEDGWKVSPPEHSQARRLWRRAARPPKAGVLRVLPMALRIHFISSDQKGVIAIENGLDEEVRIERVAFDSERFQLLDPPSTVPAGAAARLVLRHTGSETAKNLKSQVTVYIRRGSQAESFDIPVAYNVVSRGTRALFGLTVDDAEKLEGANGLSPVLQFSDKSRQPLPPRAKTETSEPQTGREW